MKFVKFIIFNFVVSCLLVGCLQSCKTTKYIDRVKTVTDSTSIKQRDALARVLKETIEDFEKEREQWENLGVTFDNTPCPDSQNVVTKIIFDNGKIKSIEGKVKALNQSLYEKQSELYDAHSTIDSLSSVKEQSYITVTKTITITKKEIERKWFIPWWVWVIVGVGTLFGAHPYVKRLLKYSPLTKK